MRRNAEARCDPPRNLPAEIGGTTRRQWGTVSIHRYRSAYTREGKVTYMGSRRELYWSLRQPILVHSTTYIGRRVDLYSSAQRPI